MNNSSTNIITSFTSLNNNECRELLLNEFFQRNVELITLCDISRCINLYKLLRMSHVGRKINIFI